MLNVLSRSLVVSSPSVRQWSGNWEDESWTSGSGGEAGSHGLSRDGRRPLSGSGRVVVLVDEPAAGRVTSDRFAWADPRDAVEIVGRALVQASVGSVRVVVLVVLLDKHTQLAFVPDDGAVEEFVAVGPHPSFGERIRLELLGRSRSELAELSEAGVI
jgi:hypothetical protein